jgi:DNA (cytosine-5)-methyltransferase 1
MQPLREGERPILLDLYCKAGGAARGYQEAGFEVWGVDHDPQPNYAGDHFIQADAVEFLQEHWAWIVNTFAAVHASPPCQAYTVYGNNSAHVRDDHPELIEATRELLAETGLPYAIENVPGAPLINPIQLCGTSFPPLEIRRHRLFESNVPLLSMPCNHGRLTERKYPGSTNRPNGRTVCNIGEWRVPLEQQQAAIDIDWMSVPELSQAVPPAYTHFIGSQLIEHLQLREVSDAAA